MTRLLPSRRGLALICAALWLATGTCLAQDKPSSDPATASSGESNKSADSANSKSAPQGKAQRKRRPPADPHRPWGEGVRDGTFMGRALAPVMSYLGADWLIRPEREIEEEPERLLDALNLKPGMVVADVGAGVGYTSVRIARRVSPGGKVLATDIQPEMVRMLRQNVRQMRMDGVVKPVLCEADDPKLPEGEVDLAILVDVYHECTHPIETLRGIRRALKPDGRLVLVEFRGEDPEVPIKPEHKMTVEQVLREIEPQGFRLKERLDFLPWQHIFIFEKAPDKARPVEGERSPGGAVEPEKTRPAAEEQSKA